MINDQERRDRPQEGASGDERSKTLVEQIANENRAETSNGNRESLPDSKAGSAQRGGPDIDKAQERQPPDATVAREPSP